MIQTKYLAKTYTNTISSPNSNLDGSGDITEIIPSISNNLIIKNLIIKATESTSFGMIRLFLNDGTGNPKLFQEIQVPAIYQSYSDYSYYRIVPLNLNISEGTSLFATTETNDEFNIIVEALEWSYSTSYSELSIEFNSNTGINLVQSPNSFLDGSGEMSVILNSGSDTEGYMGTIMTAIIIKAQQNVTNGMIRLFIKNANSGTIFLFSEISIPNFEYSSTTQSFIFKAPFTMTIEPNCTIYASTEKGELFSVIIEAFDWYYLNN